MVQFNVSEGNQTDDHIPHPRAGTMGFMEHNMTAVYGTVMNLT
jgi:hypothetical protein